AWYNDGVAAGVGERAEKRSRVGVESVDFSVLNIADQQGVAELSKMGGGTNNSPRINQWPGARGVSRKMVGSEQIAIHIKHIHYAAKGRAKEGAERDIKFAILVFDSEYAVPRILCGDVWIGERAQGIEVVTIDVYMVKRDIRRIKNVLALTVLAHGQAAVESSYR